MRFFVLLIACLLDENRMPRVKKSHAEGNCPHDASVFSRLPLDGINLLGNTFRQWFTNVACQGTTAIEDIFVHKSTD